MNLSGSPCATLFITVLVLRLLTENRCDSMSYQRACGPRQGGNFDNTIFQPPYQRGCHKSSRKFVANCVANLSQRSTPFFRNRRALYQFVTQFNRRYQFQDQPRSLNVHGMMGFKDQRTPSREQSDTLHAIIGYCPRSAHCVLLLQTHGHMRVDLEMPCKTGVNQSLLHEICGLSVCNHM